MNPTELAFNNCTLALLEHCFELRLQLGHTTLDNWLNSAQNMAISPTEREMVSLFADGLHKNAPHWNETDLSMHFIGPMFSIAQFVEQYRFNLFAQQNIEAAVNNIRLFGRVDEIIATGFREPKTPYFAFNEYKRQTDPNGDPAGQCLAAMLAGQAINEKQEPIYGCYVIGATWYFMILDGTNYAMSNSFDGRDNDESLQILRILKALKQVCMERTAHLAV